jgi:putative phosphoesterase
MRSVQVSKPEGPLEIVERDIPEPEGKQVRIKVQACGICHSDSITKEGLFPGIQYPRVPGHEIAGVIDKVGEDATHWKPGQRVAVGWHGGHCVVLHAGDFVSPIAVESFAGIKLVGILGNNDTDIPGLTSAFNKINGELKGEIFEAVYDGIKLVIYHGTSSSKKEFLINSGKYDMVIYGHTHRKASNKIGRTIVVNPGTAKGWFFGFYSTIAVFDTHTSIIKFVSL